MEKIVSLAYCQDSALPLSTESVNTKIGAGRRRRFCMVDTIEFSVQVEIFCESLRSGNFILALLRSLEYCAQARSRFENRSLRTVLR